MSQETEPEMRFAQFEELSLYFPVVTEKNHGIIYHELGAVMLISCHASYLPVLGDCRPYLKYATSIYVSFYSLYCAASLKEAFKILFRRSVKYDADRPDD
jgi:hypothetical protein